MNTTKGAANAVSGRDAKDHQPPPRSSYDFANYRGQEHQPLKSIEDLDLKMKYRVLAILDEILALKRENNEQKSTLQEVLTKLQNPVYRHALPMPRSSSTWSLTTGILTSPRLCRR